MQIKNNYCFCQTLKKQERFVLLGQEVTCPRLWRYNNDRERGRHKWCDGVGLSLGSNPSYLNYDGDDQCLLLEL